MFLSSQVNTLCKSINYQLKRISHIRKFIPVPIAKKLVTSLILSRIDYCNSLLSGMPQDQIQKIQKCQNNAARLVLGGKRNEHVTPLLYDLHWLPVSYRIDYKVLTLCFKILNSLAPSYLHVDGHFEIYEPKRTLRSSSDKTVFTQPAFNYKRIGFRSFYTYGPYIWNKLPSHLRNEKLLPTFKKNLKHHLFTQAFNL